MSIGETDTVGLGTSVEVRGLVPGSTTTIHFVPENEANYFKRRIPPSSAIAVRRISRSSTCTTRSRRKIYSISRRV